MALKDNGHSNMYRTVETGIWDDPLILKLSPEGKLLFAFLFTNRSGHVSGIFPLPRVLMAHYTGLKLVAIDTLCDTLSGLGLVHFDSSLDLVFVVNMMKHQGRGEKNQRSAGTHLSTLHNSFLISKFLEKYPEVEKYVPDGVSDRVSEVRFPPRAEQEQEQKQDKESVRGKPRSSKRSRFDPRAVPLPPSLDIPEFRKVWSARLEERAAKGSKGQLAESQVRTQLEDLEDLAKKCGIATAVARVRGATASGSQGIVFAESYLAPRNGTLPLTAPSDMPPHIPAPGLRQKPTKQQGTWFIVATGTGVEHSRRTWPAEWGPFRLTLEDWKQEWGPFPDNTDDDPPQSAHINSAVASVAALFAAH